MKAKKSLKVTIPVMVCTPSYSTPRSKVTTKARLNLNAKCSNQSHTGVVVPTGVLQVSIKVHLTKYHSHPMPKQWGILTFWRLISVWIWTLKMRYYAGIPPMMGVNIQWDIPTEVFMSWMSKILIYHHFKHFRDNNAMACSSVQVVAMIYYSHILTKENKLSC